MQVITDTPVFVGVDDGIVFVALTRDSDLIAVHPDDTASLCFALREAALRATQPAHTFPMQLETLTNERAPSGCA